MFFNKRYDYFDKKRKALFLKSKNSFTVNGDTVYISHKGWTSLAFATYREDYYQELTSYTWSINNGYPYNRTLGGGLHRYMMAKWYGDDVLKDMTQHGYVVDHMNNNHMDCQICNLEFLKANRNTAKGQYLDKENRLQQGIALSIFKDFTTRLYQITIGFNDNIMYKGKYVNSLKLLYDCDYSIVILDAEKIITLYDNEHKIDLSYLSFCDYIIDYSLDFELMEEEKNQPIIIREGEAYLVLGNGTSILESVPYKKGWIPTQNDFDK